MAISDQDIELLETYLDEALDAGEIKPLRDRLLVEPELAAELDELRAQRAMRQAVWLAMEPEPVVADRLTWRIQGAMHSQGKVAARESIRWQLPRVGSAAAACLVLGFFIGWAGRHGQAITPAPQLGQSPLAVNSNNSTRNPDEGLLVPVTNEAGEVVAWQPFKDSNDAKAFTEDLHRAHGSAAPDVRLASEVEKEKF
jgi:hypothetical protein